MRTPTVYTEKKDSKGMDNKQVFNVVKDQVQKDDQEMFYGKTVNTIVDINDIAFKNIKHNQHNTNSHVNHNLSISSRNKVKKGKFKSTKDNHQLDQEMSFMDVNNMSINKNTNKETDAYNLNN